MASPPSSSRCVAKQTDSVSDPFLSGGDFRGCTSTDEAGTFRFDQIPPGSYMVRAIDQASVMMGEASIDVTQEHTADNPQYVLVILAGAGSVSGTVYKTMPEGSVAVSGAVVAGGVELVTTDATGHYFIPAVPVGIATIQAADVAEGLTGSTQVTIISAGHVAEGIDIYLDPLGVVSGRVFDAGRRACRLPKGHIGGGGDWRILPSSGYRHQQ